MSVKRQQHEYPVEVRSARVGVLCLGVGEPSREGARPRLDECCVVNALVAGVPPVAPLGLEPRTNGL